MGRTLGQQAPHRFWPSSKGTAHFSSRVDLYPCARQRHGLTACPISKPVGDGYDAKAGSGSPEVEDRARIAEQRRVGFGNADPIHKALIRRPQRWLYVVASNGGDATIGTQ